MKKACLLTVAIPAYNVEQYLEEAISSLLDFKPEELEILIINDGSTDHTKEIALKLSKQSQIVKVINKPNGGHGSTINAAIKEAKGTYFKLLDGDDWFDKTLFNSFIKQLKKEKADIVLTEHTEFYTKSGKKIITHDYDNIEPNHLLLIDNIKFKKYGPLLSNTTIRTSILKNSNFLIDEKCYYVDQEYNFIAYVFSNTLIKYDMPIYCYRLEQEGQSMSKSSLKKNVYSHEKVCLRLIKETKNNQNLSKTKLDHLLKHVIVPICNLQYEIAIKYCNSRKAFLSFDIKLEKYPDIYNHPCVAGNIIKLHRKTKGLSLPLDPLLNKVGSTFKSSK